MIFNLNLPAILARIFNQETKTDNRIREILFCFIVTIAYGLMFNWQLETIERYFYSFVFTFMTFFALMQHRKLFAVVLPLIFVPSSLASYFQRRYNVPMNSEIIASLFETEPGEASEFITIDLIIWVAISVVLTALFIAGCFYFSKQRREKRDIWQSGFLLLIVFSSYYFAISPIENTLTAVVVSSFIIAGLASASFQHIRPAPIRVKVIKGTFFLLISVVAILSVTKANEARFFCPYSYTYASFEYYQNYQRMLLGTKNKVDIAKFPSEFDEQKGEEMVVVVIIGESVRADHFQINGYSRKTTPLLAKRAGIINFPHMKARSAGTRIAVPNILTRAATKKANKLAKETSFINLFKKHGFYTAWLTMNPIFGRSNFSTNALARSADYIFYRKEFQSGFYEARDDYLLPMYRKILAEKQGKLLIVLHTRGSHWRYDNRYPKEFAKFKPVSGISNTPADCDPEALINIYDNSILFTDYIIDTVINEVAKRKSLVVFVGDHGESLGEDGVYLHSNSKRKEQLNPPLVWWPSPTFTKYYREKLANMRKKTTENISHDHFFHTLLDLTGFKSKVIKHKLSLARRTSSPKNDPE